MQTDRWDRIHEIFDKVSQHAPEARREALEKLCPGDAELQVEILALLEHDEQADAQFLSPLEQPDGEAEQDGPDPLIGRQIHKYEIIELIAHGGMGTVYCARQEKPSRMVALKLMRAGMGSRNALRRFEYESQALARLTHPNIAQIYEADAWKDGDSGPARPYFVMEFVPEARTITDYAGQRNLDIRQKLELFLHVSDAVHYGHQRGIIHRDLKPANILVGAAGEVKVIDFGVARATDSDTAATTQLTDVGQLIGTLRYMSPEQCKADPLGLDVRSDVYSLGVVLYELLCGRPPYAVSATSITQAARAICEEPPGRPRAADRSLRGDLDIILLKSLEKDRERRYQSVADLSRDIRHYLNREPIEAKRPSKWNLITRWVAKHPLVSTTISAMLIVIIIFISARVSLSLVYRRPYRVDLSEDTHEARLISAGGNILHIWRSETDEGSLVVLKELIVIDGPSPGRVAIVGFPSQHPNPRFAGSFCAFDVESGEFDEPIWCTRIEDQDVPKEAPPIEVAAVDFHPKHVLGYVDVFDEFPGKELVVTYGHGSSRRALRILSVSDRKVLYQFWHDGSIFSVFWLKERDLLVIGGHNEEVQWPKRGGPKLQRRYCPWAIWAIRPELGQAGNRYIHTGRDAKNDFTAPVWYKCIWPPVSTDVFSSLELVAPLHASQNDGSHFNVNLLYDPKGIDRSDVVASWFVNASGKEPDIADTVETDRYTQILEERPKNFMPIGEFELRDLPPTTSEPLPDSD